LADYQPRSEKIERVGEEKQQHREEKRKEMKGNETSNETTKKLLRFV